VLGNLTPLQNQVDYQTSEFTNHGRQPRRDICMFGRMMVTPVVPVGADVDLHGASAALLQATEHPDIVRWIEFPQALLLFLMVPGDPASGAVYILDRKKATWYAVDFDDAQFGGYTIAQLEQLLRECGFLALVERPGLWRGGLSWSLEPGKPPEARV
jgi:hypothetical protein